METSKVYIGSKKHQRFILAPRSLVSRSESQKCGRAFGPTTVLAPEILNLARIWIPRIPTFFSPGVHGGVSCQTCSWMIDVFTDVRRVHEGMSCQTFSWMLDVFMDVSRVRRVHGS